MGDNTPDNIAWNSGQVTANAVETGGSVVILDTSGVFVPLYRIDLITLTLDLDITAVIAYAEVRVFVPETYVTIGAVSLAVESGEDSIQPNRAYWQSENVIYPGPCAFTLICGSVSGLGSSNASCSIFYSTAVAPFYTWP